MRLFLTLICLTLVACAPAVAPEAVEAETPATAPVQSPHTLDAAQCQAAGGEMRPVCMMGTVQCVVRYSDAGRACRDGDDCQGACRAADMAPAPGPVVGRCQATSNPCGCFANVEDGRIDAALCVD